MKIDSRGNLYCTGPGGIHVFDASGAILGVIRTPENCANFTFGDDDSEEPLHRRVDIALPAQGARAGIKTVLSSRHPCSNQVGSEAGIKAGRNCSSQHLGGYDMKKLIV